MSNYLEQQIALLQNQIDEAQKLAESDPTMAELAQEEINNLKDQQSHFQKALQSEQDYDQDNPINSKIAILEVRAAAGGEEAKIWADDLIRMYTRYIQNQKWDISPIDTGIFKIKGKGSYKKLQYEAGVHRVQRVPATESAGRIHTSTATVAVLPEIKPTQVEIKDEDVEFVAYARSAGAGGQNVNKVASAVRLTHKPTGIVVDIASERTQLGNRQIAESMLAAKVWEMEEQKRLEKLDDARSAIGRGMRAEKIRTYNYPQNRVTDHRINKSWHNLDTIIEGQIDGIIQTLIQELK